MKALHVENLDVVSGGLMSWIFQLARDEAAVYVAGKFISGSSYAGVGGNGCPGSGTGYVQTGEYGVPTGGTYGCSW